MKDTSPHPAVDETVIETLVAYMDGELSPAEASAVEQRLAVDAAYRETLRTMQRAWAMLDELPRGVPSSDFSNSTLTMVAQATTRSMKGARRESGWMPWMFGAMAFAALTVASYITSSKYLARPEKEFLRDLPVIQNVDMYRNVDDIEFLQSLIQDGPLGLVGPSTQAGPEGSEERMGG